MIEANNPNDCTGSTDWLAGLEGVNRRWVPFNGAVSPTQLAWLSGELDAALGAGERVVILTHVPIQPDSCGPSTLLWNYQEVKEVLHAAGCVVAVLCGHDHDGGYARDSQGVHHCTFHSPLEVAPPRGCHATATVFEDHIEVVGSGAQVSYTLTFDPDCKNVPTI
jgi:manganese-dependent ADP-ribose/CDP-alcohol diphosphatase